jgi:hypothetical protein
MVGGMMAYKDVIRKALAALLALALAAGLAGCWRDAPDRAGQVPGAAGQPPGGGLAGLLTALGGLPGDGAAGLGGLLDAALIARNPGSKNGRAIPRALLRLPDADMAAMAPYMGVLAGGEGFRMLGPILYYGLYDVESLTLGGYLNGWVATSGFAMVALEFAVVDMDGDGVPEVVLSIGTGGYCEFYLVLHFDGEAVCGYSMVVRAFYGLKVDGTLWAAGVGYATMAFTGRGYEWHGFLGYEYDRASGVTTHYIGGAAAAPGDYSLAEAAQEAKPDVVWYPFEGAF